MYECYFMIHFCWQLNRVWHLLSHSKDHIWYPCNKSEFDSKRFVPSLYFDLQTFFLETCLTGNKTGPYTLQHLMPNSINQEKLYLNSQNNGSSWFISVYGMNHHLQNIANNNQVSFLQTNVSCLREPLWSHVSVWNSSI